MAIPDKIVYRGGITLLLLVSLILAWDAGRDNSPTMDEPYHLMASAAYVREGVYDLNPEHPPLAKLLAGAGLAGLDLRVSERPPVTRLPFLFEEVQTFLYENRAPEASILRAGRLPFLGLFALLILLAAGWGRELGGAWGGTLAAGFVALLPLFLAHATVVHTDIAAALAFTAVFFALFRALERPWWFVGYGAFLGLALAAKFSALYLLPFSAVLLLLEMLRRRRLMVRAALAWGGAVAGAFGVLLLVYMVPLRHMEPAAQAAALRGHLAKMKVDEGAIRAVERLTELSQPLAHYAAGVLYVQKINGTGQGINYFLGEKRIGGFPLYFPAAFVIKTPLLFLLLLGLGFTGGRWKWMDGMLLVPVLLYFLVSLGSSYNIGVRHLAPVFPLLALFAARRLGERRFAPVLTGVFLAGALASALWARPQYMSDFNLLFSRHPERFLADSNLDWGQDWGRAAAFARERGWSEGPVVVVYGGTARPERGFPLGVLWDEARFIPGNAVYAVSVMTELTGPEFYAVFGRHEEAARLRALLDRLRGAGFREVPCTRAVSFFVPVRP